MKTLLLFGLLFPHHYKVCVASAAGEGCTSFKFSNKEATKIAAILQQAPIDAKYDVWIEDTRKKKPSTIQLPPNHPTAAPNTGPTAQNDKL